MIKDLKSLDILLVEDEPQIQKYFKEVFEYFFNKVFIASDGKEALEIFKAQNISAIFTDYSMPVLNGYELTLEIRKINKDIPITIISNHDDREKLQQCIPLRLMGYLFKPLSYEDIKEYINFFAQEFINNGLYEHKFSDDCRLNFSKYTLTIEDKHQILTKMELAFLKLMISNENKIVLYDTIYENLFEYEATQTTIKNLVYRLKTKYQFNFIKNIKDVGYVLVKNDK